MRRHNTDEAAWDNESLPWEERVEAKRLAMQEQELTSGVDRRHVRVITTDDAERTMAATKEDQLVAQIGLINERLAGLEGHLWGRDGSNGAFGDLRADLKGVIHCMNQMHDELHGIKEWQAAELAKQEHRIDLMKKDVDAVGEIAREVRDRSRDTIKKLKGALIGIGAAAATSAIWAGVQALI